MRKEILAGVPDRYLKVIEYSKEVEWEEEGEEFSLHGDFYDIVRIKKVDGKMLLYCLSDENEDELVRKFSKIVKHSAGSETGRTQKQIFKLNIMEQPVTYVLSTVTTPGCIHHKYPTYVAALAHYFKEVIIPPPWSLCS